MTGPIPAAARRRLRVLLLLPSLHGGGAERLALHLMNHIDRRRFDVRMGLLETTGPYLRDVDPNLILSPEIGAKFMDFEKGNARNYRPDRMLAGVIFAPLNVARMIERFDPDVILSFRKGMNLVTMGARWLARASRPSWIAREGNNTFAVLNEELKSRPARAFMTWLTGRCYASTDRLLTISYQMAEELQAELGIPSERVVTIHNAVDLDRVREAASVELAEAPAAPYLVTVGRLEPQKGYDLLLAAYAQSEARRTHHLVIAGRGSREQELKGRAHELGIAERVHFLGWTDNPWAWMKRADAFILSSRWEGFGNVVIEAMACGLPLVVTDCKYGPKEIVESGVHGYVARTGDADDLREKIDALVSDPLSRKRMAQAARAHAENFDVRRIVDRYQSCFEEIAYRRAAGASSEGTG